MTKEPRGRAQDGGAMSDLWVIGKEVSLPLAQKHIKARGDSGLAADILLTSTVREASFRPVSSSSNDGMSGASGWWS